MAQLGEEKAAGANGGRSQRRTRLASPRSPDASQMPADYPEGSHRVYQKKIKDDNATDGKGKLRCSMAKFISNTQHAMTQWKVQGGCG